MRAIPVFPLLLLVTACGGEDSSTPAAGDEVPMQIIYGYHTIETHQGQVQWELWGRTAERFAGDDELHLKGVRMVFYEEGVKNATLTSLTGLVNETTRNMRARGDVHIVSEDGRTLTSEVLYWDNRRQLIHSDVFFRGTTVDDQILTGVGLETDPDMTNLKVLSQVEGEAPPQNDGEDRR